MCLVRTMAGRFFHPALAIAVSQWSMLEWAFTTSGFQARRNRRIARMPRGDFRFMATAVQATP